MKYNELYGEAIGKIFYDKVGEIIDRGFPREIAKRIAFEYIAKFLQEEKESESDRKIY